MFRRLFNVIRGIFGSSISKLEKNNAESLLELEKENLRSQVAKFNKGLASHASMSEKLISQIKKLNSDKESLRAKTLAYIESNNKELAGQFALQLKTVERELQENNNQLEEAEKTYKELVSARDVSIKSARKKINDLKLSITDMKMKDAMAELNEMASGLVTEIGGSGDTLDRLHEMVEEERAKSAGRARVAKDTLNTTEFKEMELEQKAMTDLALADFATSEGITLDSERDKSLTDYKSKKKSIKSMGKDKLAE